MEIWALENITSVNIDTPITMFLYSLAITAQRSNTTVEFQLCVAFDASISQAGMLNTVNLLTQSDIQGPAAK